MKLRAAIMWGIVGIVASSAGALALPLDKTTTGPDPKVVSNVPVADSQWHVTVGRTLLLDARLGHASIGHGAAGETFLFASVTGSDTAGATAPPLDLAIVVDRSGSMKGERMANALIAAGTAVDRMRDGDSVVVVSFDTQAEVVVPPTRVSSASRPGIEAAIRSIRLGGDTCISCGLEEAGRQLAQMPRSGDRVARMLLLSDGATNHGIRDIPGLRTMAARMRDRGCPVTTIGVDVDFDEKVMGAIATESNGNHYFVASASGLPAVFSKEFDTLVATVAQDGELVVDPAPGVEIEQVFDRAFRREGSRIIVPFGSFSAKDEKSLLLKLRVPADRDGSQPVADLKLTYRDLMDRNDARFGGSLSVGVRSDGTEQRDMDPFVRARVERSTTARTLAEANELMNKGRFDEARAKLSGRSADLEKAQSAAKSAPRPSPAPVRARRFEQDFDDQAAALGKANQAANAAASAAPGDRKQREAPKELEQQLQSNPFR
jgi:Ca-activated chloride channel family protein